MHENHLDLLYCVYHGLAGALAPECHWGAILPGPDPISWASYPLLGQKSYIVRLKQDEYHDGTCPDIDRFMCMLLLLHVPVDIDIDPQTPLDDYLLKHIA